MSKRKNWIARDSDYRCLIVPCNSTAIKIALKEANTERIKEISLFSEKIKLKIKLLMEKFLIENKTASEISKETKISYDRVLRILRGEMSSRYLPLYFSVCKEYGFNWYMFEERNNSNKLRHLNQNREQDEKKIS